MFKMSQLYLLSLGKALCCEKQSKPPVFDKKNSRTRPKILHWSFALTQSTGIKTWLGSPVNK